MNYSDIFTVDKERCTRCGDCKRACPLHFIIEDAGGYPVMTEADAAHCDCCGHCVIQCPNGAFHHREVPLEQCPLILDELKISEEQAIQFLRSRRSYRKFREDPIGKNELVRLIELARYAPTGGNMECVEWSVVADKQKARQISELTIDYFRTVVKEDPDAMDGLFQTAVECWDEGEDFVFCNSPTVITAMAPPYDPTERINLTIALTYLDLFAHAKGFATCWAGLINFALPHVPELKRLMNIPQEYEYYYSIIIGYPEESVKFFRLPERKYPKITFAE